MIQLTVHELNSLIGGQLTFGNPAPRDREATMCGAISTDSRTIQPGQIFWALNGPRHDGADFADQAFDRGGHGVVAAREMMPPARSWCIEVADSTRALWQLAEKKRADFGGTVVAVTGSLGKTTTRQMIHTVLGYRLKGTASTRNYNNHWGVPLTMSAWHADHDYAVAELGASAPGEIDRLARLVRPQVGVITQTGEAHLGGFGSRQAVAQAKAELLETLTKEGWAVLAGDDPLLRRAAGNCSARIVWVGRGTDCNLQAIGVMSLGGRLRFRVQNQKFSLPVWGRHHLGSALAAIAVGQIFGLSLHEIAEALNEYHGVPMRCEVSQAAGATMINDTYNANPTAMRAALELLREVEAPGRRIVVCGDMRELGNAAAEMHRQLGDQVVTLCGADRLVACGEHAGNVAEAAVAAGMPSARVAIYRAPTDAVPHLANEIQPGDAVLFKGSRAMAMERLVKELTCVPLRKAA